MAYTAVDIACSRLLTVSAFGSRVSPVAHYPGTGTPHASVSKTDAQPLAYSSDGSSGADDERIEVNVFATTHREVTDAINDARGVLDNLTGAYHGRVVSACFLESTGADQELSSPDDQPRGLFMSSLIYRMIHHPSP